MHFCVHCGVRVEDAAQPVCPNCGAPRAGEPAGAAGPGGYVRVGATRLPVWLPWALVAVLAAGGVTIAIAVTHRSDTSSAGGLPVGAVSPGTTYGDEGATPSTGDGYGTTPTYPDDGGSSDDGGGGGYEDGSDTDTAEPSQDTQDASTVVTTYYDRLNAGNYSAAWDMGGRNLFKGSYSQWVAGFDSTAHVEVTATDDGYGDVRVDIRASQTDGSVRVYTGTYTVQDGEIVGADIQQVS
ncbi:hypothetical protein GCM10010503_15210 [Streptomyces lucensis JCM 4490]|uniref:Uncharacterized protein n=1 Tax=Streptomyces lucensis JCM 4490 TaxID=1306176 RepID=A0A918IZ13_9ACTN|nr:zinc ribbon domain-containing protein [Streptomyces lucensis]GGW39790.1 hypothetical protein GCM10010503_15210 [Streptomyces lucensis JCM 4490]